MPTIRTYASKIQALWKGYLVRNMIAEVANTRPLIRLRDTWSVDGKLVLDRFGKFTQWVTSGAKGADARVVDLAQLTPNQTIWLEECITPLQAYWRHAAKVRAARRLQRKWRAIKLGQQERTAVRIVRAYLKK